MDPFFGIFFGIRLSLSLEKYRRSLNPIESCGLGFMEWKNGMQPDLIARVQATFKAPEGDEDGDDDEDW